MPLTKSFCYSALNLHFSGIEGKAHFFIFRYSNNPQILIQISPQILRAIVCIPFRFYDMHSENYCKKFRGSVYPSYHNKCELNL
jgi:hypothetical protein